METQSLNALHYTDDYTPSGRKHISEDIVYAEAANNSLHTNVLDILSILNVLKKWWWLIVSAAVLTLGLASLVVFRLTPIYVASSVIEIKQKERQIFNSSEIDGLVVDQEFFATQVELLKSVSLAESIINNQNLLSDPDFKDSKGQSRDDRLRYAVRKYFKRMHISPVGRSRLIKVSFEHASPRTSARIANDITDTFISLNLERKYNATSYARSFIEDRLKVTKAILEESERDLVQYATANNLVTVRDPQGNIQPGYLDAAALVLLDKELTIAQTKRVEHEKRYSLAQNHVNVPDIQLAGTLIALKTQFMKLNSEYLEKLAFYTPNFPEMQELKTRIDYLETQIDNETQDMQSTTLSELKAKYEVALTNEQELLLRVNALKGKVANIRNKSVGYNIKKREVDTNRTQYDALLNRLKEVSVSDDIGSNLVTLVDQAKKPVRPSKPNKLLYLSLALFLGGSFGVVLAFVLEKIDDRIKSPDDIKTKLKSVVMGVIPDMKNIDEMSVVLSDPQSSIAEAYASLRTNLQFSGPDGGPQVIHLTSTRSGEGKSVSSLGLSLRFAGLKQKVLLIDADMRLPTFSNTNQQSIGLSGLLTSNGNPVDHILKSKHDNLYLLPSGKSVPNPSELLSQYKMEELLDYARKHFDYVIVDSPPVLGLADAPVLAARCDASILIVEFASMRTPAIKSTIERLKVRGVKFLGVVLTKYKAPTKGYLNYYKYNYGEAASQYGVSNKGKKSQEAMNKKYIDLF